MHFKGMSDAELRHALKTLAREMVTEGRRTLVRSKEPNVVEVIAGRVIESLRLLVDELPAERRAWAMTVVAEEILIDRLRATSRVSPGERRN
jgi:hypothetical protein